MILPKWGTPFAITYCVGLATGRWVFHGYPNGWIWPEILAMLALAWVPLFFAGMRSRRQAEFDEIHARKLAEYEKLSGSANSLNRENEKIEKQLRDIGHLYDVMREAGSTLNVQEMLILAKEYTERMFNLSHFVMAMLSEDGKHYEIKVSSGCDETRFHNLLVEVAPTKFAARLAKERRTLWVADMKDHLEFAHLNDLSIRSLVFIPFIVQNQVIGFFCSFSTSEEFLNAEQFTNLQIFFNQISIGLQKALLYEKVQRLSITDGLTRLYSHRYFRQRLDEELVLVKRYTSHLSLLILDIDHFKRYNDSYGHVAGDQVLQETAKILRDKCDATHLVARYGGEEMVVLAPEVSKEQAMDLAERIRAGVEGYSFKVGKESTGVTVSIGVAAYPEDAVSSTDLISQSDKALYAAKEAGRNRVVAYYAGLRMPEKKIDTPGSGG